MATNAAADPGAATVELRDNSMKGHLQTSDDSKLNHNSTSTSNAEGDLQQSSAHESKEDPATMAASEELKHTTISDRAEAAKNGEISEESLAEPSLEAKDEKVAERQITPETDSNDAHDVEMAQRVASPKKKRGREQEEDNEELQGEDGNEDGSSTDEHGASRTTRSGPEKKRHRDDSEEPAIVTEKAEKKVTNMLDKTNPTSTETAEKPEEAKESSTGGIESKVPETSSEAFAKSGFASIAKSETSPFGTVGTSKPSVFGSGGGASTFGGFAGSKATSGGFGSSAGDKSTSAFSSGFGAAKTGFGGALGAGSPFGSGLGNGFAGGSDFKLSSFAAPGKEHAPLEKKPEKPFGAPDSDDEGSGADDDGDDEAGSGSGDDEDGRVDDKKKIKLAKVPIEDGEAEEVTILQIRAKLFALQSKETGWKERGVGTLKVNVHRDTMDFWPSGQFTPGSFDPSTMKSEDAPVARLVMRQENTHRVILNTIIYKALEFKDKPSTTGAQMFFTAMEGDAEPKPIQMLLKMNEANGRAFRSETEIIKRELP